MYVTLYPV